MRPLPQHVTVGVPARPVVHFSATRRFYAFEGPDWGIRSTSCKDLVNHLLATDPDDRFDVDQALQHPWVVYEGMPLTCVAVDVASIRCVVCVVDVPYAPVSSRAGTRYPPKYSRVCGSFPGFCC